MPVTSLELEVDKSGIILQQKKKSKNCLLLVLTVRVVAVHVPFLTFVQPVAIVDDANLAKPTVGPSFDNRVAHSP